VRRALAIVCVICLGIIGCVSPRTAPSRPPEVVQAEVRRAIDQFSETAGRADLAGLLALFDANADIMVVGSDKGEVFKGRAAIEGWVAALFKSNAFSWQMDRVDISHNGDTAWAFVDGRMNVSNKTTGQLRLSSPYRFSAVLVKRGDRWVWRLFHGSAPKGE
jgi:ketosteroid isomerase-like protein